MGEFGWPPGIGRDGKVIRYAESKQDKNPWLMNLIGRRNKNIAAVALANKNIRIIWAMMTKGTDFNPRHISTAPISR
jgi:transposase